MRPPKPPCRIVRIPFFVSFLMMKNMAGNPYLGGVLKSGRCGDQHVHLRPLTARKRTVGEKAMIPNCYPKTAHKEPCAARDDGLPRPIPERCGIKTVESNCVQQTHKKNVHRVQFFFSLCHRYPPPFFFLSARLFKELYPPSG